MPGANWPLAGYTVVDLSAGIAGAYCTKMLTDGGANVVKLEPPAGNPLRRWSASGATIPPGEDGALFQFLACSQESVVVDPADASAVEAAAGLIRRAGAVVWTPGSPLAGLPRFHPAALRQAAPAATIVAITPFGLEGPWTGLPATDFTLQAWSGSTAIRGLPGREPLTTGGQPGEWMAGAIAAASLLASRWRTLATGSGELVDVSILETLSYSMNMYSLTYSTIASGPPRTARTTNIPDVLPARDGWVGFQAATARMFQEFSEMVGHPEWNEADPPLYITRNRQARRDELLAAMRAWTSQRTTAEIIELASARRIPVAPIGTGATLPAMEQFTQRGFYVANPRGGFLQPGAPYVFSSGNCPMPPEAPPRLGEHTARATVSATPSAAPANATLTARARLPLEGHRVADFTGYWAGPIVSHFLAMLGAEVIKVEAAERPDGLRSHTVLPPGTDQWWEWVPIFMGTNTNKRDITLDLATERGRELAKRLISECDIVLENYTPRVFEQFGLGYDTVHQLRPDAIMMRMPAFGLSGPWRDWPGYAQTMEHVSGIAWSTGYEGGDPYIPNGFCDAVAGTHATVALLLALEHRRRTGEGCLVEVPMVGGALNIAAEQVIEYSAYGNLLTRMGNRSRHAAPQGVYRSADVEPGGSRDAWVGVAVETDAQWEALVHALGDPPWARDPTLATAAGRRAAHDAVDHELAAWCAARTADTIVETLWPAGVPIAKLLFAHQLDQLRQLQARGFFETLHHPLTGTNLYWGYPARFGNGPHQMNRAPSPLLGQHNREVLCGLLGVAEEELAALERAGVIGTRPGGALKPR